MNSLNDICYERINDSYHYGLFGDFKLVIDKTTGYFNATKLCNFGGKQFKQWKRLEKSQELIKYIENLRSGNPHPWKYEIISNNKHDICKKYTGVYVCDDLILDIASWISPEFYMKCNNIIKHYFKNEFKNLSDKDIKNKIQRNINKYTNIIEEKELEINDLNSKLNNIIDQNNKILETNKNLENQNKQLLELAKKQNIKLDDIEYELIEVKEELNETSYKLDDLTQTVEENILPDRNIPPSDPKLKHNLLIYKVDEYIYKIVRAQSKLSNNFIKSIPVNNVIINEYVPNPIDMVNRMRLAVKENHSKILLKTKKDNKEKSKEEIRIIYNSIKPFEIKNNKITLNNSTIDHILILFDKLKQEQFKY
ncbi:N1R/p28-like protein [Adoxophyes honmai entomopoxvirus 'L']|uniref:N1R/p28-like protein n=1 Tax=Adoxophyes honmai entomopoxvirus 'L' TaxID=1293540 RepID=A0A916KNX7_9POXV|nr:N1R/p28-like protein [Adoxophyes honmai entomopoxvirus 'L']CCU55398.1 N1R/p28-like protein [Adoxophyes honmai entomopoxvirus 'L']